MSDIEQEIEGLERRVQRANSALGRLVKKTDLLGYVSYLLDRLDKSEAQCKEARREVTKAYTKRKKARRREVLLWAEYKELRDERDAALLLVAKQAVEIEALRVLAERTPNHVPEIRGHQQPTHGRMSIGKPPVKP